MSRRPRFSQLCDSLRLNAGVPATRVAEWAGYSVEVLLTIYAKGFSGRDQVWFERIDKALRGEWL
jgi:hypothetical protein